MVKKHFVRAIPTPTMSFCQQRPSPPSCRFSLRSIASSEVTVLAKLTGCALRAVAHTACAQSQNWRCHFVGNAQWHCPSPPSCRFSSRSYASSKVTVLAKLAVHASRAVVHTACTQSQNRRCHFVGNAHLLLHADFHCAPTLLAR